MEKDIDDQIELGIVEILDEEEETRGTGFFVTSDGCILTAYHVIRDIEPSQIKIEIQDKDKTKLKVELNKDFSDQDLDFAVLKVNDEKVKENYNFSCLHLGTIVNNGDPWCTKGFEISDRHHGVPNSGKLQGYAENSKNGDFRDIILTADNKIMGGISGSPIFNKNVSKVVGMFSEEMHEHRGHAVSIETIFNKLPKLKQLNSESISINYLLLDWKALLIVTNLQRLLGRENTINKTIQSILDCCKIDIPSSINGDLCYTFAIKMLNLGFYNSRKILQRLCEFDNDFDLNFFVDILVPSWVNPHAAICVKNCAINKENKPVVLLNSNNLDTARMYIYRAINKKPNHINIFELNAVYDPLMSIEEQIEELLIDSLVSEDCDDKKDELQSTLEYLNDDEIPVFILLLYDDNIARLLPRIQNTFSLVTFFVLTGDKKLEDVEGNLIGLHFKFIEPFLDRDFEIQELEKCKKTTKIVENQCFKKNKSHMGVRHAIYENIQSRQQ